MRYHDSLPVLPSARPFYGSVPFFIHRIKDGTVRGNGRVGDAEVWTRVGFRFMCVAYTARCRPAARISHQRRCCSSRRRLTPPSHRFKPAITNYRMYARPRPASPDDAPALSHAVGRVLRQTGDAAATFTFPRTMKEDEFPCIFHSRRGPRSPADSRARI